MKLVVSIRRSHREVAPEDWIDKIRSLAGITVDGDTLFGRVIVEIEDSDEEALRANFGEYLHIEPLIQHRPTGDPPEKAP